MYLFIESSKMSFKKQSELAVKEMSRARRLLVFETVRNMKRRYGTYVRRHTRQQRVAISKTNPLSFREWLQSHSYEATYLSSGIGGHQLLVRQSLTQDVFANISLVTVGVNQPIDWFLQALGVALTEQVPNYVVTVHHNTTNSSRFTASPSLFFKVELDRLRHV